MNTESTQDGLNGWMGGVTILLTALLTTHPDRALLQAEIARVSVVLLDGTFGDDAGLSERAKQKARDYVDTLLRIRPMPRETHPLLRPGNRPPPQA